MKSYEILYEVSYLNEKLGQCRLTSNDPHAFKKNKKKLNKQKQKNARTGNELNVVNKNS